MGRFVIRSGRSAFWKAQLRQWHWISSAICLAGLLLFAVTGFTLNHAGLIEAMPETITRDIKLSPTLRANLGKAVDGQPLATGLAKALETETGIGVAGRQDAK